MRQLLNTLYVTTRDARLMLSNAGVVIRKPNGEKVRVAGQSVESIVCLGNTVITTPMVRWCGENNIGIVFLSETGAFCGRVFGSTQGNVMLRLEQYRNLIEDNEIRKSICKNILMAKLNNSRVMLQRALRDAEPLHRDRLADAIIRIRKVEKLVPDIEDLDAQRGWEGTAANIYFSVFNDMIKSKEPEMEFHGRNRRPPKDCVNAMLSFLYTLLAHDAQNALETVGLDPECGYFHSLRSGKPGLALDLMEEYRAMLCDRVVLTLINRKQVTAKDFEKTKSAVLMTDQTRALVLKTWHDKKKEMIQHPVFGENIPLGLLIYGQAQLLARAIRGQEKEYKPFLLK